MKKEKPTTPPGNDIRKTSASSAAIDRPASAPPRSPDRVKRIQEAAYRRAQERGFGPGAELDDWLAAEREIDAGSGAPSDKAR